MFKWKGDLRLWIWTLPFFETRKSPFLGFQKWDLGQPENPPDTYLPPQKGPHLPKQWDGMFPLKLAMVISQLFGILSPRFSLLPWQAQMTNAGSIYFGNISKLTSLCRFLLLHGQFPLSFVFMASWYLEADIWGQVNKLTSLMEIGPRPQINWQHYFPKLKPMQFFL